MSRTGEYTWDLRDRFRHNRADGHSFRCAEACRKFYELSFSTSLWGTIKPATEFNESTVADTKTELPTRSEPLSKKLEAERKRYVLYVDDGYSSGYTSATERLRTPRPGEEPNLITSRIEGRPDDIQAPCIDIDIPSRLVPSRTPGHNHLYFDVEVPWDKYMNLLDALVDCGIVESGYRDMAKKDGFTACRKPSVENEWETIRENYRTDPLFSELV